jgi:hypothetical protein
MPKFVPLMKGIVATFFKLYLFVNKNIIDKIL